jgi:hypothetical protein
MKDINSATPEDLIKCMVGQVLSERIIKLREPLRDSIDGSNVMFGIVRRLPRLKCHLKL